MRDNYKSNNTDAQVKMIKNQSQKNKPSTNDDPSKRIETKTYNKRVESGHELTFEKYLDAKSNGKGLRKPRVPVFRKKEATNQPQQIIKKIKRDNMNAE